MLNGNNDRSLAHCSDFPSIRNVRIRLMVWLAVVACLIAWPIPSAVAQSVDPCELLTNELEKIAKQAVGNLPATAKPKELNRNNTPRYAVDDLVSKLAPFAAEIHNEKLASGNLAWVTFESNKFKQIKDADVSKVCVRAYVPTDSNPAVPIQQVILFEKKEQEKGLKVAFKVEPSSTLWYWPWTKVDYLIFGVIPDTSSSTPPTTSPTFFAHRATITVANNSGTAILSLLFVVVAYLFLAWTTYRRKEDLTKLKELAGGKWLLFALSPVRISAAWFGEASMSQLQLLIFTFVVAGLMLSLFLRSGTLSELSMDLLKLIGISSVGTATAKFTQTRKTDLKAETARFLIGKGWHQWDLKAIQDTATLRHLLLTDNRLDVYKFQMLIFTVLVALYVISAGQTGLGEVKISDTMLYLMGISQVVYVGGKAVTDRTTDLENAVAKMMELEPKLKDAKATALTPEQKEWLAEYRKAAETATYEFAFLQNRDYPRATPDDPNSKPAPAVLVPTQSLAL